MTDNNPKDEKQAELDKYRDLLLATLDYYQYNNFMQIKTTVFNSNQHYNELKIQAEEYYQKGQLTRLKQWFRDFTEMLVETGDLKFNQYLQDNTKYNIDIFKSYFQRIDRIVQKGKITTDKQFYDVRLMVDQLCQTEPVNAKKIELLNGLLSDYEQRKSRMIKKPNA